MVALAFTIGLSVFAIVKAKGAQMPVFGLALLNGWYCLVAALIAAMATTGSWM
ncbi:hypothetical protein D3C80_2188410 [compost metagenome]